MNLYLAVIVMGAVEDEGTFWIQLLMMVILAAGAGIYILVKSRAKHVELRAHDEVIETIIEPPVVSLPALSLSKGVEPPKPIVKNKDVTGGMELLAQNFLVSVVEQIDSADQRDITMRRLCFTELSRRGELWAIASTALKIYTLDKDGFYGKVIRSEAMAELAGRTRPGEGAAEDSETTNEPGRTQTAKKSQNVAEIHPALTADQEPATSVQHHAD